MLSNWQIFKDLLEKNKCKIAYEGDSFYLRVYIFYNSNMNNRRFFNDLNMHSRFLGMKEDFITFENYVNALSFYDLKILYEDTERYIENLKEIEQWYNDTVNKMK